MATRSPTRRLGSACSSRRWRAARGRAGARGGAGARDGPAQTNLTTLRLIGPEGEPARVSRLLRWPKRPVELRGHHRAIRPTVTSRRTRGRTRRRARRRTRRRTRRPSGRAVKVPPATHRPCTHCALSVHHRHAPAVHSRLTACSVLRPRPRRATYCISYAYGRGTRATAAGHRAVCHAREPRRPPPDAGRRSEAPAAVRAKSQLAVSQRVSSHPRRARTGGGDFILWL